MANVVSSAPHHQIDIDNDDNDDMSVSKRKPHAPAVADAAASAPVAPYNAPVAAAQRFGAVVLDDYRSGSAFISAAGVANLKFYKYTGDDRSFLGRLVLFQLYGWMAYQCPLWLAPNLLTLAGLLCNLLALLLCGLFVVPMFGGAAVPPSPAVLVAVGSLLWLYQALDNMDGKQARRTGSSSALGELFDHVCDCSCVTVFTMVVASCVGLDVYSMLVMSWLSILGFHLSHWEEYYTNTLVMGALNGPTEAILAIVAAIYWTALVGADWWSVAVPGLADVTRRDAILWLFCGSAALTSLMYAQNTIATVRRLGVPLTQALSELLPLLIGAAANGVWFWASVQTNGWNRDIASQSPVLFTLQAGLFIAYLETRLLTQRICRERAPVLYLINAPAVFAAALNVAEYAGWLVLDEPTLLLVVFAVHLLFFANCVFSITTQLTAALKINVFTIPY
jgi:ethanolaminephosphotransferase